MDVRRVVSRFEEAAWTGDVGDWEELVVISLVGRLAYKCNILGSSARSNCVAAAICTIVALARCRFDVEGDISVALLDDVDLRCQVASLGLLCGWKVFDFRADQEDVR